MPRDHSPRLLRFSRELRRSQTDAEAKLWSILRDRRSGGYKFRRQQPVAGYILDFYCDEGQLAVELDGGQHGDASALEYDELRTKKLNALDIRVLRFWDHDVLKDTRIVAEHIYRQLEERPSPQPSPGVPGEGVRESALQ